MLRVPGFSKFIEIYAPGSRFFIFSVKLVPGLCIFGPGKPGADFWHWVQPEQLIFPLGLTWAGVVRQAVSYHDEFQILEMNFISVHALFSKKLLEPSEVSVFLKILPISKCFSDVS